MGGADRVTLLISAVESASGSSGLLLDSLSLPSPSPPSLSLSPDRKKNQSRRKQLRVGKRREKAGLSEAAAVFVVRLPTKLFFCFSSSSSSLFSAISLFFSAIWSQKINKIVEEEEEEEGRRSFSLSLSFLAKFLLLLLLPRPSSCISLTTEIDPEKEEGGEECRRKEGRVGWHG